MPRIRRLTVVAICLIALAGPTLAWTPTAEQETALATRIDSFRAAFEKGDFEAIMAVLPDRLMDVISAQAGVSAEQIKSAMAEMMAQVMAEVELESYSMELDDAQYLTTDSGMQYVLVPTRTRLKVNDMRVEALGYTLALEDEGKLYLLRIDDANQITLLQQAYPDFAGVEFPQGTQTVLE